MLLMTHGKGLGEIKYKLEIVILILYIFNVFSLFLCTFTDSFIKGEDGDLISYSMRIGKSKLQL